MSITLATTFNPRGEIGRLQRLWPQIRAIYSDVIISLPPSVWVEDLAIIRELESSTILVNGNWSHGRYNALRLAKDTDSAHIHYADMDRLLRWHETQPEELLQTVERIKQCECLVIGRTTAAWDTHPKSMRQTETISNQLFSSILGQELDLSAGSKGFSHTALDFLIANTQPGEAIGTDAEWVVLCHRAGFKIDTTQVDGLDWEIPDRYQDVAADSLRQHQVSAEYDADAQNWAHRVQITQEIFESGMNALNRELIRTQNKSDEKEKIS